MSPAHAVPVTFVTPSAELGGAEQYLVALLEQLDEPWRRGVVALQDGPMAARFAQLAPSFELVPTSARLGVVDGARRLRRILLRDRPSVVHANGVKAALVAALAVWRGGPPVVWVKHDFSWDGPLARFVASRCRFVVGVSGAVAAAVGAHANVRVVPNGLPALAPDRGEGRTRLLSATGLAGEAEIIVQVGRLEPGKGQLELVEQLPLLRRLRPDAQLVLIGPASRPHPSFGAQLEERARTLGVGDALTLLGARDDAIALMAGADVVAVATHPYTKPGTGEGFGLVAAEAMAVGTPVVAYAHGGLTEVVGDAGLLVPPLDARSLALGVARLLGEPVWRRRLARAGVERAARFDQQRVVAAMQDVYRDAASASR